MRKLAALLASLIVPGAGAAAAETGPMQGPFGDVTQVCTPCTTLAKVAGAGVAAPIREVRVIVAGDLDAAPSPARASPHGLAIRTAAGWYVAALGASGAICGGRAPSLVSIDARTPVVHDVVGDAAPEVELDVDTDVIGGGPQVRDRHHYVCGRDAATGAPRCVDLFVRRRAQRSADSWDYTLALSRAAVARLRDDRDGHADQTVTLDLR